MTPQEKLVREKTLALSFEFGHAGLSKTEKDYLVYLWVEKEKRELFETWRRNNPSVDVADEEGKKNELFVEKRYLGNTIFLWIGESLKDSREGAK